MTLAGYARTLEREVAVWLCDGSAYVTDRDAPKDIDGIPLGLRPAPMAVALAVRGDLGHRMDVGWSDPSDKGGA